MNGLGHAPIGFNIGVTGGILTGLPWWGSLLCGTISAAAASGHTSPDADTSAWWHFLDQKIPRLLDRGRLAHRHLSHWPIWPALTAALLTACDVRLQVTGAPLPHGPVLVPVEPAGWAWLQGWTSHLVVDRTWTALGWRAGGRAERIATRVMSGVASWLIVATVAGLAWPLDVVRAALAVT